MVKNLPASAEDMSSIPGRGRSHIPRSSKARAPQLLKHMCLKPVLHKRSYSIEKPGHHNEREDAAFSVQENSHSNEDPAQPKINKSALIKKKNTHTYSGPVF